MADSQGPGVHVHAVRDCATLGFSDLGDVGGFEEPGQGTYGFFLLKDGFYIRTPVQPAEPEWDVKLTIKPPHTYLRPMREKDKERILSYLGNAGRMLVSYAPRKPQKALAAVDGRSSLYILRPTVDTNTNIPIYATTNYGKDLETLEKPPADCTIVLTLVLGEPSPAKWIEVLPKLKIQWDTPMVCMVISQNNKVRTTSPALRTQVVERDKKEGIIGCHYFQIEPRVAFLQLLFTTASVPDSYLEILTSDIDRLNALITKP